MKNSISPENEVDEEEPYKNQDDNVGEEEKPWLHPKIENKKVAGLSSVTIFHTSTGDNLTYVILLSRFTGGNG